MDAPGRWKERLGTWKLKRDVRGGTMMLGLVPGCEWRNMDGQLRGGKAWGGVGGFEKRLIIWRGSSACLRGRLPLPCSGQLRRPDAGERNFSPLSYQVPMLTYVSSPNSNLTSKNLASFSSPNTTPHISTPLVRSPIPSEAACSSTGASGRFSALLSAEPRK